MIVIKIPDETAYFYALRPWLRDRRIIHRYRHGPRTITFYTRKSASSFILTHGGKVVK